MTFVWECGKQNRSATHVSIRISNSGCTVISIACYDRCHVDTMFLFSHGNKLMRLGVARSCQRNVKNDANLIHRKQTDKRLVHFLKTQRTAFCLLYICCTVCFAVARVRTQIQVFTMSKENDWPDEDLIQQMILETQETSPPCTKSDAVQQEVNMAVQASKKHQAFQETVLRIHGMRLQNLLTANGLTRIKVPGNGNGFFEASCFHLGQVTRPNDLREQVCYHIMDNVEPYSGFFDLPTIDENERFMNILQMIEDLRRSGCWNTRAGDLLPLALANVTKRPVKIFTSRQTHPVVDIRPSIDPQVHVRMEPIYLTLTALKNQPQHYDACIRRKTTSNQTDMRLPSLHQLRNLTDECEASPVEKSTLKHDDCAVDFSIEESTEKHGECGFSPVRASTPIHTGCDSTPPHESSCPTPVNISFVCASTSAYVDSDSTPVTTNTITSDDTNFDFFPNGVFTSACDMSDTAPSCESTTASPPSCYGTPAKKTAISEEGGILCDTSKEEV
ncbi:uncharacterized protein [Littorina saxatilis]|uniref:uncharacterized protein n=1 Tax=Littorina saxatilis TaxID=31220 RepID=UPI0038B5E019